MNDQSTQPSDLSRQAGRRLTPDVTGDPHRPRWDVAALYPRLDRKLRRILSANLRMPDWVIDDACQMAWTALLADPPAVDDSQVLGWLATTARREALLMVRRNAIELRVVEGGLSGSSEETDAEDPQRAVEHAERLGQIRQLPPRQQRVVWMHGLGYRYDEIAAETGQTIRTVQRQLLRARRRLDSAA